MYNRIRTHFASKFGSCCIDSLTNISKSSANGCSVVSDSKVFYDYDKIPVRIKMKTYMQYHTPTVLRPFIRAHFWKQENKGKFPYYLTREYLDTVFPPSELDISEYINIDKIII